MSRESRFHDLIEAQDPEGKAAAWERIRKRLEEEPIPMPEPKKKRRSPAFRRMVAACVSCALVVVVGLSVGLGIGLSQPVDSTRYCKEGDYEIVLSEKSLKEYSETNNLSVLYLDWYASAEDCVSRVYRLNNTNEIICFQEEFADAEWNSIVLYVTDNRTEISNLSWIEKSQGNEVMINNVSVYYLLGQGTHANFEYKKNRYYLSLDIEDTDYIISIARQLLEKA